MYNLTQKEHIYKWVAKNKVKYNEYQKEKQKEYYQSNPELKLKKKNEYQYKKIRMIFMNILIDVVV
jgi:hypothetical protein